MANLSVQNWQEVDFKVRGFPDTVRWDEYWEVETPPLPPLDASDPFAVKNYIFELVRQSAIAGIDFTFFRLIADGSTVQAQCRISVKLPDDYKIEGLQEWEIRYIANRRDFDKWPPFEVLPLP